VNREELENYIKNNYEISLDKIFDEIDPDRNIITHEVNLFLDKLNSLYEVKEEFNLRFTQGF